MSDEFAVRLDGVGKMYKLFSSRTDGLLDSVGLGRVFGRGIRYREFWALRGIHLGLTTGERVGVIGRNGAGKTTLLKLITGNLPPTEGDVRVNGQVQALLEAGAGFHPDFTGSENIRAALTYQGMTSSEISDAEEEIASFTELGDFLTQPFKTYSTGMQARLAFATATVVRPEILIVDEILGAGDAYFVAKSNERMRQLVERGATVLLVSHSMLQVTQLCEKVAWLERGEIVSLGDSIEIVKEYEAFIRKLDDRRLRAKNVKRKLKPAASSLELDRPQLDLQLDFTLAGPEEAEFDLRGVRLFSHGEELDALHLGAPQDAGRSHSAFVMLDGGWSPPYDEADGYFRRLTRTDSAKPAGSVFFELLDATEHPGWEVELLYRLTSRSQVAVAASLGDSSPLQVAALEPTEPWRVERLPLRIPAAAPLLVASPAGVGGRASGAELRHWPGEGSLIVSSIELLDRFDAPRAVHEVDSVLTIRIGFEVMAENTYDVLPVVNIYRLDGTNITTLIGDWLQRQFSPGVTHHVSVTLDPLNLGNGNYLVSVAMYKSFDPHLVGEPVAYDWVDRSVEFEVTGSPPAITSIFLHPSKWRVE